MVRKPLKKQNFLSKEGEGWWKLNHTMKLEKSLGDSKIIINKNCFQEQLISGKEIRG